MNTRRSAGRRVAGGNPAPPQAPAAGVQVLVNPAPLMDGEVRDTLVHMAQAINTQPQAITAQATREGSPRDNPYTRTMASRLRDFIRMNLQCTVGPRKIKIPMSL